MESLSVPPAAAPAAAPTYPRPVSLRKRDSMHRVHGPRRVEVDIFDVLRLIEVDNVKQTFTAQFLCQLRFVGGAMDEHLKADEERDDKGRVKFPLDDQGKPTYLPSAWWYLDQIECNNLLPGSSHVLDKKVTKDGSDLVLQLRIDGEFTTKLELADFPCDMQKLPINLVICCRNGGPVAVDIVEPPAACGQIVRSGFVMDQLWDLRTEVGGDAVLVHLYDHGRPGRLFPAISAVIHVHRKPYFHLLNVAAPMTLFSLLAFLQYQVPADAVSDRLAISLTLLLTSAAYKFAASSLVPPISYMTAVDTYVTYAAAHLALSTIAGGTVDMLSRAAAPALAVRAAWGGDKGDEGYEGNITGRLLRVATGSKGHVMGHPDDANAMTANEEATDRAVLVILAVLWLYIHLRAISWVLKTTKTTLSEALAYGLGLGSPRKPSSEAAAEMH